MLRFTMNPLCIFVLVFLSHVRVGLAFTYNTTRGLPILVAPYDKKTFWVDKSCTDRRGKNGEPVWDNILGDTIEMACAVKKSLSHSPVDTDFAQVFWILFNVEVTDERRKFPMSSKYQQRFINHDEKTAKAMVLDIVTDLCDNWSQIPSGDQSTPSQVAQTYLRIYCDNALASEGKRLRKLPNGRIADVNNAMLDTADCGSEEIVLNGKKKTLYTNAFTHSKAMERDSQNPDRAVVTLCDIAFENSVVLKDFDPQKDWQAFKGAKDNILKVRVGPFRMLTSFTMLHEWMHVYPYLLSDMKTRLRDGTLNPFSPYRWENCVQKLSVEALSNAESLAYVGLMATFARLTRQHMETSAITGGYTLERVPQDMDDVDAIAAHEESLSNGHLFFYHDITTTGVPGSPNADS